MEQSKKICHYFDMPIQHISNTILNKMKRRSTKEHITTLIEKIRHRIPDVIIRTSIIVGFPGETNNDFDILKDFIEKYKLDRVGIFTYSAEEGTEAAVMDNQISQDVMDMRKNELMSIQSKISLEKNNMLIGKKISIIIEGVAKDSKYYGRSYGDAPEIDQTVFINAHGRNIEIGEIVDVKIINAFTYDLVGDVCNEPS